MDKKSLELAKKFEKLAAFGDVMDEEIEEAPPTQRSPVFTLEESPRELLITVQVLVGEMIRNLDKGNTAMLQYRAHELKWRADEINEMFSGD